LEAFIGFISVFVDFSLVAVKNAEIVKHKAGDDDLGRVLHLSESDAGGQDVEALLDDAECLFDEKPGFSMGPVETALEAFLGTSIGSQQPILDRIGAVSEQNCPIKWPPACLKVPPEAALLKHVRVVALAWVVGVDVEELAAGSGHGQHIDAVLMMAIDEVIFGGLGRSHRDVRSVHCSGDLGELCKLKELGDNRGGILRPADDFRLEAGDRRGYAVDGAADGACAGPVNIPHDMEERVGAGEVEKQEQLLSDCEHALPLLPIL